MWSEQAWIWINGDRFSKRPAPKVQASSGARGHIPTGHALHFNSLRSTFRGNLSYSEKLWPISVLIRAWARLEISDLKATGDKLQSKTFHTNFYLSFWKKVVQPKNLFWWSIYVSVSYGIVTEFLISAVIEATNHTTLTYVFGLLN